MSKQEKISDEIKRTLLRRAGWRSNTTTPNAKIWWIESWLHKDAVVRQTLAGAWAIYQRENTLADMEILIEQSAEMCDE